MATREAVHLQSDKEDAFLRQYNLATEAAKVSALNFTSIQFDVQIDLLNGRL